jgi:hypothetical protein
MPARTVSTLDAVGERSAYPGPQRRRDLLVLVEAKADTPTDLVPGHRGVQDRERAEALAGPALLEVREGAASALARRRVGVTTTRELGRLRRRLHEVGLHSPPKTRASAR